jgi:hypothetical protein
MAEIVFRPIFRLATGLEFVGQGFGRGKTMRGAMNRIFWIEGIVMYAAAQQASLLAVSAWKIGPFCLFFKQILSF